MQIFILFLEFQKGLESLIVEGLENIVRVSDPDDPRYGDYVSGFEGFYNYLPHFISKPSFKLLRVTRCTIPANSVESMISTFLSNPTTHDQSLEFLECDITDRCDKTYSKEFPLLIQTNTPCVCGEHKSLSISLGHSPAFSERWLFEYSDLKLNRLNLHYRSFGPSSQQALDAFPESNIDFLSCKFNHIGHDEDKRQGPRISSLTRLSNLSEIELIRINNDELVQSMLANAFRHPLHLISLKRLRLECLNRKIGELQHFFDALFSMPKEQLADFSLEVVEVNVSPEEIYKLWKANSKNQKLRKFVYIIRKHQLFQVPGILGGPALGLQPFPDAATVVLQTFPDMAVDISVNLYD